MKNKFVLEAKRLVNLGDKFIKKSGTKNFHTFAHDQLAATNLPKLFDYKALVETSFSKEFNHHQNFSSLEFSDLPITIARGKDCFIDVYFWRRRPTVIHNHHFSGAFQCLQGLNVDSEFKFKAQKKLTVLHTLGELTLHRTQELRPGDIMAINVLDKFIHQNHHHADLTINLCFRTPELSNKNLSNYLFSGLKFEKDPLAIARAQRLYAFTRIEDFNAKKINITMTDAFCFLTQFFFSNSQHSRLLALKKILDQKIKKEFGLSLTQLLVAHEEELDKIQSFYE